jgi:hypothetical protein
MPLHLYRRHQGKCEANRPIDSRSGEFDERKVEEVRVFHLRIRCAAGKFKRKYTGRTGGMKPSSLCMSGKKLAHGMEKYRGMAAEAEQAMEALRRVEDKADASPFPSHLRPHTFAEAGVTVRMVAELLGNVRKHDSAWVPERQAEIAKVFRREAQPKFTAIKGGRT